MQDKKEDVQAKIKLVYNNVYFVHCYAHQINFIMENEANITRGLKIFFSNRSRILRFFSRLLLVYSFSIIT